PEDFAHIRELGCDHIRLPINLLAFADEQGRLDTLFLRYLDQVVDWAQAAGLVIILDNHTFDPHVPTDPGIRDHLIATWQSMARHFRNRWSGVLYEILNEPHGIPDATWASIQQEVISAIRQIDSTHTIVVGPANWNKLLNLQNLPQYADTNLIYTFHFYEPFLFTHQGASWTNPPMTSLAGVPFPYEASRMPDLPAELRGTWLESRYNQYPLHGNADWVKNRLEIAVRFSRQRGVRIWCGEFGAYMPNSTTEDRARWLQVVRTYLEENQVPWTMWEYSGGFGIFEPGSDEIFESDLNVPILEALGLNVPPQKEPGSHPDTTGFDIYNDGLAPGLIEDSWVSEGTVDLHWTQDPHDGDACLHIEGLARYNYVGMRFKPARDLSYLVSHGYALDMWVRCNRPNAAIEVRFVDTKAGPDDHPWRIGYALGGQDSSWTGEWQHVAIPLKSFQERGSWDEGQWYDPQGLFDWHQVQSFEIVARQDGLAGTAFDFDEIRIAGAPTHVAASAPTPQSFRLWPVYPNPLAGGKTPRLHFPLTVRRPGKVRLTVYNVLGEVVDSVEHTFRTPGRQVLTWPPRGARLLAGVYFYKVRYQGVERTGKFTVLP
ncbi:MAG TPA: T9SS type A sorting domain-containing protein, partial [Bacteroidetes bacterium]|nr:T9SS type A sorting domain-containing protein [Bacteroidota bacterium]